MTLMDTQQRHEAPETITLQDGARELRINVKTLKRWLAIEGIHPTEDARDRRRKLITRDELSRIGELIGDVPDLRITTPSDAARFAALEQQVQLLVTSVVASGNRAAAMEESIIALTHQVLELRNSNAALEQRLNDLPQVQPSGGPRSFGHA